MVNISRSFLASTRRIASRCTNPDVIYEAMKQTFKTSLEYKRTIHVKNLYQELKKDGIGTTRIESRRDNIGVGMNKPPSYLVRDFSGFL